MNASIQPDAVTPAHTPRRRRLLPIVLGAILVWALLLVGSELLWQHSFGFSRQSAWMLSVALFAYLALFVLAMVGIAAALGGDH